MEGGAVPGRPGPVLVSGSTGRQGAAVVRALLREGWNVRAMTRDPLSKAAKELADAGATPIRGDFDDVGSLCAALDGAHGVFGVQDFWEAGYDGEIRQGKALIDAAREAGVSHFVYASVGATERTSGLGITHFDTKRAIEEHLRESGLPFTVLRPVTFFENFSTPRYVKSLVDTGRLRFVFAPDVPFQMVAASDIGHFAALAFAAPDRFVGREIELAGDELTMREFAEVLATALGRPVRYDELPLRWMTPLLHLVGWTRQSKRYRVGPSIAAHARWSRGRPGGGWSADIAALRALHPALVTAEQWARSVDWRELRDSLR